MVTDEEFEGLKERVEKLEEAVFVKKEVPAITTKLSFGEFARQKNPKTSLEKSITIIYYVWKYENRNFTYDDIETHCKKVAWPTYSNPAVLIKELKRKGFIEEVGENSEGKIEYRILENGIKFVENNFKKG